MRVLKFGGTSVQDSAAMSNVVRIIESRSSSPLLVVVSACAGVTNSLLDLIRHAVEGNIETVLTQLEALRLRHEGIALDLLGEQSASGFIGQLEKDCAVLKQKLQLASLELKLSREDTDLIVSFGESWSSRLLCDALSRQGIPAEYVDSRDLLITDDEFTKATPLFEETNLKVQETVMPLFTQGKVVVTQGFVGRTADGLTTTIGRGGSDYSASIFGAALGVEEIEIWTDTDGILSADPRLVSAAVPLREISTEEATELAHFGAKVVHPSTLAPATDARIPVRVLNSFNPRSHGTLIRQADGTAAPALFEVKSITGKKGVCLVAIKKDKRMNKFHFLQHVFHVLENHKEAVEFISSSETGVLVLTNDEEDHRPFLDELRHHDGVEVREELAIVSVVGALSGDERSVLSRILDVLQTEDVPIYLSYNGVSSRSVAIVVDGNRFEEAISVLHDHFVKVSFELFSLKRRALRLIAQAGIA